MKEIFAMLRNGQLHHMHRDRSVFEKWMKDDPWLYPPGVCTIVRYVPDETDNLVNILQANEMEKKVLYEALERALSHFAVMGGEQATRAAQEIEELFEDVAANKTVS